jgi:hypothetical protein
MVCMHACMCVHRKHTYIHACMHTHTHMHTLLTYKRGSTQASRVASTHVHAHTYICTYMYTYMHTRKVSPACIQARVANTHSHPHNYLHTYIHACIHTYILTIEEMAACTQNRAANSTTTVKGRTWNRIHKPGETCTRLQARARNSTYTAKYLSFQRNLIPITPTAHRRRPFHQDTNFTDMKSTKQESTHVPFTSTPPR